MTEVHRLARRAQDAIAAAKTGVCRAAVDDLRELHAVLAVGLGELHAEVAVLDAPPPTSCETTERTTSTGTA